MTTLTKVRVRCARTNHEYDKTWRTVSNHVLHNSWDPDMALNNAVRNARQQMIGTSLEPFVIEAHTLEGKKPSRGKRLLQLLLLKA